MNLTAKVNSDRLLMLIGLALSGALGDLADGLWVGSARSSTISNGTLAVDFYDPTLKNRIWRGTEAQTLNPSGNRQKDMQKPNKEVAKLLKNYLRSAKVNRFLIEHRYEPELKRRSS